MWGDPRPAILFGHALSEISEIRQFREMRQIGPTFSFAPPPGGKSDAPDLFSVVPKASFGDMCRMRQISPTFLFGTLWGQIGRCGSIFDTPEVDF